MLERTNRRPSALTRGLPPVLYLALLGPFMAIVGLMHAAPAFGISLNALSNVLLAVGIGLVGLSFLLLVIHIVHLARELDKTKARVEELEANGA